MLDRARPANTAVANEPSRFVVPLGEQKIDRVLQRAGRSMVVLWRDEDIAIERTNLRSPCFSMRFTVCPIEGGTGSSRSGRLKSLMSTSSNSSVAALFRDFVDPFRDGFTVSIRARASENDCDLYHVMSYLRVLILPYQVCCAAVPFICEFVSKGAAAVLGERAIWRARSRDGNVANVPSKMNG